ncbi:MAG TPA: hypothetical protein VM870_09225 [Pyrinomonadaceae bacterium]|nr:hypothetical protein [Pyrinomonadaceae bacterium]
MALTFPALALQMSTDDPMFWIMVIVALSFVVIAVAMLVIATMVGRVTKALGRLEERVEPLVGKVSALSEQGQLLAAQGKEIAAQVSQMSGHLATASLHFSESAAIVRDEVRDLKQLVGLTTETAREKVALVSRTIDHTNQQLLSTTSFVQTKIVEPAREISAIMAGLKRGLEVFVAPSPKPINQSYGDDEMFIG